MNPYHNMAFKPLKFSIMLIAAAIENFELVAWRVLELTQNANVQFCSLRTDMLPWTSQQSPHGYLFLVIVRS